MRFPQTFYEYFMKYIFKQGTNCRNFKPFRSWFSQIGTYVYTYVHICESINWNVIPGSFHIEKVYGKTCVLISNNKHFPTKISHAWIRWFDAQIGVFFALKFSPPKFLVFHLRQFSNVASFAHWKWTTALNGEWHDVGDGVVVYFAMILNFQMTNVSADIIKLNFCFDIHTIFRLGSDKCA